MATALTILTDALLEIGVLSSGETPDTDQQTDGLRSLNRLMEKLSNARAFAYFADEVSQALTGQASFDIGPTGDVVDLRPIKIESATATYNGVTYPVEVYSFQQWDAIPDKTTTGTIPQIVYYEGVMPDGVVKVYPICTGSTLKLRILNVVTSFATINTALSMPPGYEEALVKNLAINIAPQYQVTNINPITVKEAKSALAYIERVNTVIPKLSLDSRLPGLHNNHQSIYYM
jgi:hypothetical protein